MSSTVKWVNSAFLSEKVLKSKVQNGIEFTVKNIISPTTAKWKTRVERTNWFYYLDMFKEFFQSF